MPIYEFTCRTCGEEFTEVLSLADYEKHQVECPKCGSREVEQVVAPFSVVTSHKS